MGRRRREGPRGDEEEDVRGRSESEKEGVRARERGEVRPRRSSRLRLPYCTNHVSHYASILFSNSTYMTEVSSLILDLHILISLSTQRSSIFRFCHCSIRPSLPPYWPAASPRRDVAGGWLPTATTPTSRCAPAFALDWPRRIIGLPLRGHLSLHSAHLSRLQVAAINGNSQMGPFF